MTNPKNRKNKKCEIWWCQNQHYALGYCKAHWAAFKRFGTPYGKHKPQLSLMDDAILASRLIALEIIEFTENKDICPFCQLENGNHKDLCIVPLSRNLLNKTDHNLT